MIALERETWRGRPVPPVVEAWMDTLMQPEWVPLFETMAGKHIDFTLFWAPGDRTKKPEVRIS
jgi:cell wall assembly regulator SMI1